MNLPRSLVTCLYELGYIIRLKALSNLHYRGRMYSGPLSGETIEPLWLVVFDPAPSPLYLGAHLLNASPHLDHCLRRARPPSYWNGRLARVRDGHLPRRHHPVPCRFGTSRAQADRPPRVVDLWTVRLVCRNQRTRRNAIVQCRSEFLLRWRAVLALFRLHRKRGKLQALCSSFKLQLLGCGAGGQVVKLHVAQRAGALKGCGYVLVRTWTYTSGYLLVSTATELTIFANVIRFIS